MLVRALRAFSDALSLARSGGNPRLELETALLRFILTAEDPTIDALAARVATLEEGAGAPPPAPQPKAPPAAEPKAPPAAEPKAPPVAERKAPAEISLQKVRAAWQSIRSKVESERQPLRGPLSRAQIEAVDGNAIVLKLPDTWSADALRDHAKLVEAAIADVLGVGLKVTLRVDGNASRAKGSAPGNVASMTAAQPDDGADALFDYAKERIR